MINFSITNWRLKERRRVNYSMPLLSFSECRKFICNVANFPSCYFFFCRKLTQWSLFICHNALLFILRQNARSPFKLNVFQGFLQNCFRGVEESTSDDRQFKNCCISYHFLWRDTFCLSFSNPFILQKINDILCQESKWKRN